MKEEMNNKFTFENGLGRKINNVTIQEAVDLLNDDLKNAEKIFCSHSTDHSMEVSIETIKRFIDTRGYYDIYLCADSSQVRKIYSMEE